MAIRIPKCTLNLFLLYYWVTLLILVSISQFSLSTENKVAELNKSATKKGQSKVSKMSVVPRIENTGSLKRNRKSAAYAMSFHPLEFYCQFEIKLYEYFQSILLQVKTDSLEISALAEEKINL